MRKIIDFGRAKYATVELKRGEIIYVAMQKIRLTPIDWKNLTKLARGAKVEAQ